MKLGISAFAWTARFGRSHLDLLPRIKAMGFDGVEIAMFAPRRLPIAAIRKACEASALECTVCAILPRGINPISPQAAARRKARRHLLDCIEAAAEMGARLIGGPLYAPIGYLPGHRPTNGEWAWAVEAFQSLGDALDRHQMQLAIEPVNRSETFFLRTAGAAKALCAAIGHPRIGVTVDTFHANIEEQNIPAAILALGPSLSHLHASENDRGIPGRGHVDFAGILAALRTIRYDGYLMIEGFGYVSAEKHAPGVLWAEMDVSPEKLALEGKQFFLTLLNA